MSSLDRRSMLALAGLGTLRVRLTPSTMAFVLCQALAAFMLPLTNSLAGEFWGFNRYWLLVFPAFFLLASVVVRSPAALFGWLGFSLMYTWNVELCFHLTRNQQFGVCPCLNK